MRRHTKSWLLALALATATLAWGCATSDPPEDNADAQLDALAQQVRAYKRDAERAPDSLSPERKAELQQLAKDARAWQARTGRDDIRVTDKRMTTARRMVDGGGGGTCDADCPVYTFGDDAICFLSSSVCDTDPDDVIGGTICIYSCISIASSPRAP